MAAPSSGVAKGSTSWYLKVNHKGAMVGADAAKIKAGDEVLFALAESDPKTFAYPDELALVVPAKATAGRRPITVLINCSAVPNAEASLARRAARVLSSTRW